MREGFMDGKNILRHSLTAWIPSLSILAALVASAGSTTLARGPITNPVEILLYLVIGTLAALHHPRTGPGTLGLGTVIIPSVLLRWGALPAAVLASLITALVFTWRQRILPRGGQEKMSWSRQAENAVLSAGSVLFAGSIFFLVTLPPDSTLGLWGLVLALAYMVASFLLLIVRHFLEAGRHHGLVGWREDSLVFAVPLLSDGFGWIVGGLLYDVALTAGQGPVTLLMLAFSLVAAEAARSDYLRRDAELRRENLERLQQAHKRILGEISGMGGIAAQILVECRNVLPVQWFQFELLLDIPQQPSDGPCRSWAAGPDGILMEGQPSPDSRPQVLPGIHRRASWRILEKKLRAEGEVLAVVRLWCDPRRMESGAEELFGTLIPQMASSVHRAQLDREAKLDPLTGVPVRRLLESRLQRAYRGCMEEGRSMAVILCDIDHFKKVNDTHGHAAGDEALKLFARTLDTHRRDSDLCCRYGGEEFTLLLENTGGDAALRLAERLRTAVEALELVYEGQSISLTFSSGVAAFPELHIKTASELLLLADEALYEAKEQGRNRSLLNVGRGAYRTVSGQIIRTQEEVPQSQVFRLFR